MSESKPNEPNAEDQPRRGKKRRVARYLSEQDQRALAEGKTPSWEQKVKVEGDNHANDERLLRNVPPHW